MVKLKLTDEVRQVLACRSERNKIAVPRDCAACPVRLLPIVSALVREGYLVFLDCCPAGTWGDPPAPFAADIYLLTPKGVAFCTDNNIKRST